MREAAAAPSRDAASWARKVDRLAVDAREGVRGTNVAWRRLTGPVQGFGKMGPKTQKALKADHTIATRVGQKLFPAHEASLIAELIRRDLPFYDPTVSREFVSGMTEFQRQMGLIDREVAYEDVVATQFSRHWNA